MPSEEEQGIPEPSGSGTKASETTPLLSTNVKENMETDGGDVITKGGLSVMQTAFLIAGAMAGPGVLAMPHALVRMGWLGVPVIIGICAVAAFCGKRFADCWSIVEQRNPSLRQGSRNPYSAIVYAALGPTWGCSKINRGTKRKAAEELNNETEPKPTTPSSEGFEEFYLYNSKYDRDLVEALDEYESKLNFEKAAAALCILVALVGAGAVYLLLAAQLLYSSLLSITTITYCMWILVVTLAVAPYEFFGTPKDFHLIGVIAFLSTLVASVLYFIQILTDSMPFPIFRYGLHGFTDFFLAFGVILFAFAGGSTFPTLQNDMADKTQFYKSINYSFAALLSLYLSIAVAGYLVYGEGASPNIVDAMKPTSLTLAGNIFMIVHLLSAFVIIINPVCQEMEDMYNVSRDSLGCRIFVRGCIMLCVLFVATSVPRFQTLLSLIGSTPVALLTFLLPAYCYMKLDRRPDATAQSARGPNDLNWLFKACGVVLTVGLACAVMASYTAIRDVFTTVQAKACYIK